jgi:two-component system sensor histidine kinase DesK
MRLLPKDEFLSWTPYVWLIYLVYVPVPLILGGAQGWQWLGTIASMAVFLVFYFWSYWVDDVRMLMPISGMVLIGALCAPWNPAASTYFIYAGASAGHMRTGKLAVRTMALVAMAIVAEAAVLKLSVWFWFPALFFSLMTGGTTFHVRQKQRSNRKLSLAQDEVERLAKIAERERIARDLHDVLGHTLSVIVLKAELASKLSSIDLERAVREMKDIERISREALTEVRSAIRGYRAAGLDAELSNARATLETAGVKAEIEAGTVNLPPALEGVLSLAVREAVTNVVRHADAMRCRIVFDQADGGCRLEIQDDGRGGNAPEGTGLTGMRERIEALGGTVSRETASGTRLLITIPTHPQSNYNGMQVA